MCALWFVTIHAGPIGSTLYIHTRQALWPCRPTLSVRDAANRRPNAALPLWGTPSQKEYACVAGSRLGTCGGIRHGVWHTCGCSCFSCTGSGLKVRGARPDWAPEAAFATGCGARAVAAAFHAQGVDFKCGEQDLTGHLWRHSPQGVAHVRLQLLFVQREWTLSAGSKT